MTVQTYECWSEELEHPLDSILRTEKYTACSPEAAAEYFLEDNWDGHEGDTLVSVRAEDGTVYEVTVSVEVTSPSFRAKN